MSVCVHAYVCVCVYFTCACVCFCLYTVHLHHRSDLQLDKLIPHTQVNYRGLSFHPEDFASPRQVYSVNQRITLLLTFINQNNLHFIKQHMRILFITIHNSCNNN